MKQSDITGTSDGSMKNYKRSLVNIGMESYFDQENYGHTNKNNKRFKSKEDNNHHYSNEAIKTRSSREKEMNLWLLDKCGLTNINKIHLNKNEYSCYNNIEMEEGWQMIETNGLKVIVQLLDDLFPRKINSKPLCKQTFGASGISSLYTISYKLVNDDRFLDDYDPSIDFYNRVNKFVSEHLNSTEVVRLFERSKNAECSLKDLVSHWQSFKYLIKWICSFFGHLEKYKIAFKFF
jgi:hypothetical protein